MHPQKRDSVAQLVEQYTFNVWALGSNPSGITKEVHFERSGLFCLIPNQACLSEGKNKKVRALCNKVGFMLGLSPN